MLLFYFLIHLNSKSIQMSDDSSLNWILSVWVGLCNLKKLVRNKTTSEQLLRLQRASNRRWYWLLAFGLLHKEWAAKKGQIFSKFLFYQSHPLQPIRRLKWCGGITLPSKSKQAVCVAFVKNICIFLSIVTCKPRLAANSISSTNADWSSQFLTVNKRIDPWIWESRVR